MLQTVVIHHEVEEIKKIQMFLTCNSLKGGRGWRLELLIGQTTNMYVSFDKKKNIFDTAVCLYYEFSLILWLVQRWIREHARKSFPVSSAADNDYREGHVR